MESHKEGATSSDTTIAAAMSRELHKTAQPLALLNALVGFMQDRVAAGECQNPHDRSGKPATALNVCEDCKFFVHQVGGQIPRLSNSFNEVRRLAGLQRPARDIANFSISGLVTEVMQTLGKDLDMAGIGVAFDEQPNQDAMDIVVRASHSRVYEGVRVILMALADCADDGDRIKISVEGDSSHVILKFRSSRLAQLEGTAQHDPRLSTLTPQLEFAQLLVESVGGKLCSNSTPDHVVMSLPKTAAEPYTAAHGSLARSMHV